MTDFSGRAKGDASFQAGVGLLNYDELPGLENIVLEDSFVREIVESEGAISFVIVAALTPEHPFYRPPERTDRHFYIAATIRFPSAKAEWKERRERRFTDAQGAVDLGNIDRFVALPHGAYHLEGDWGSVDIVSRAPIVTVVGTSPGMRRFRRDMLAQWVRSGTSSPAHEHHPHDHQHHDHQHGGGHSHEE